LDAYGEVLGDYQMPNRREPKTIKSATRRHLKSSGIPVESSKCEYGRGQNELNIRYADVLTMSDRHVRDKGSVSRGRF